jgi:hypothetical protein
MSNSLGRAIFIFPLNCVFACGLQLRALSVDIMYRVIRNSQVKTLGRHEHRWNTEHDLARLVA